MNPDFAAGSALTQLLTAFNAGLLTSLTPCIYPLIPITLAIFGASTQPSRARSFLLALCYVLGIATTYTALGMLSAKTGGVFGSFLGQPWVIACLSLLLVALALFSLDIIKFGKIAKVQDAASRIGGKGFRGAFLMGTVSGFVAAPCAGPMLVVILGIAAAQQNTLWGAILLFTYAMGMGLLFLVLGLFPGLLKLLPRSGNWLHGVKFLTAALLLMVVLFISQPYHVPYLAESFLEYDWIVWMLVLISVAGGLFGYRIQNAALKFLSSFVLAVAVFYAAVQPTQPGSHAQTGELTWLPSLERTLQVAEERSTIAMVDLYADWCAACKELERHTFSNEDVQQRLKQLALGRIDFTLTSDATDKITERYQVAGLPWILFLTPDGNEIPGSRITGFLPAEEFLKHLEIVQGNPQATKNPSS